MADYFYKLCSDSDLIVLFNVLNDLQCISAYTDNLFLRHLSDELYTVYRNIDRSRGVDASIVNDENNL